MEKYISVLKRTRIFDGLTEEEILSALSCLGATTKCYKKDAVIYTEGDTANFIGIILSGEIEIQKTDYDGNANIISKLFPSELIAAAAAFSTKKQLPFDVVAVCETEVLRLDSIKLLTACSKACSFHVKIIENLLCVLADKNINLSSKIDILSQRTIREKILFFLYSRSKKKKSESFAISPGGLGINEKPDNSLRYEVAINLTRRQMADFLSVNRSALSRELCKMRDEGILEFNGNIFKLK